MDPKERLTFLCRRCRFKWSGAPVTITPDDTNEYHPFIYTATCERCGNEEVKPIGWEYNLEKAHALATGPRTIEGRKRISESTRERMKDPAITNKTRFNALKHGAYAKVANYYPARPGHYAACSTCDRLDNVCGQDGIEVCLKKAELFMRHHHAFDTGDPALLSEDNASLQANVRAIADEMILTIINDGVRVKKPVMHNTPGGSIHVSVKNEEGIDEFLYDLQAHPLIGPFMALLSRNHLTMQDMNMTPRKEDLEDENLGFVSEEEMQTIDLQEWLNKEEEALNNLAEMIERSKEITEKDPLVLEHKAEIENE